MMQNEKTVADKVLEQLEIRIDLIATKFMNGKSDRLESQKELEGIEGICRDILNVLYPIAEEKTKFVYELFMKTADLMKNTMKYYEFNEHGHCALIVVKEKEGRDALEKAFEIYHEFVNRDSVKEEGVLTVLSYPEAFNVYRKAMSEVRPTEAIDEYIKEFNAYEDTVILVDGAVV
ncbi:hypothetical protein B4084_0924 [Bacillus cereus]|nr:hypothetical protein B4084_0924 [Bacillus cereus]